ncbi:UNVERIFIED_CONTAM: hypothetical protein Slati_0795700, partial [Sesamum latifolium]
PSEAPTPKKRNPKLVNFSLPSDSESDSESTAEKTATKEVDKSKLPPPYNPFDKKPVVEDPEDPKNLQEVFAKIREDGHEQCGQDVRRIVSRRPNPRSPGALLPNQGQRADAGCGGAHGCGGGVRECRTGERGAQVYLRMLGVGFCRMLTVIV